MQMKKLMIAFLLVSNYPLVAGAVTDSEREPTSGLERALEVAPDKARGLQSATHPGPAAPIPEPSSLVLLATGMLLKRAQRGQLPLVEAVKKLQGELLSAPSLPTANVPDDVRLVANAKKIASVRNALD